MAPLVLGPGEGEVVGKNPARVAVLKASTEELALTEFRYAAGGKGPPRHIHETHADGFWVLSGELTVELGPDGEDVRLGEGDFGLAPIGLVHTFRNDGPAEAVFLNLHAPGAGFGEYMIAMRDARSDEERQAAAERFDQHPPPQDGGLELSEAVLVRAGEGERTDLGGHLLTVKAAAERAGGAIRVSESVLAGDHPGPEVRRHEDLTDSFYVLDGVLGMLLGDRRLQLPQGAYALVPPGTEHTFFNPHGHPARVLSLAMPARG